MTHPFSYPYSDIMIHITSVNSFSKKMGADGGSIPTRVDMVRTKGYGTTQKSSQGGMGYRPNFVGRMDEETLDPKIRRRLLMSTCTLTQRDFTPSTRIVCDRIGWLYDKEALIKALLDKTLPVDFDHLTTLKDAAVRGAVMTNTSYRVCSVRRIGIRFKVAPGVIR
jgi:hypothetical protein